jgi:hypothetical protein
MVARMFQVMYQGNYGTATHESQLAVLMQNSLSKDAPISLATAHIDRVSYLVSHRLHRASLLLCIHYQISFTSG